MAKAIKTFSQGFFSESWQLLAALEAHSLSEKDLKWSRMNVTLVIDSSIYKQLLSLGDDIPEFDKFFSGQYHATVYGFRLPLIGLVIGGCFYPLSFYMSSKEYQERDIAKQLLEEVKQTLNLLKTAEDIVFPNLFLSVDSGFCHPYGEDSSAPRHAVRHHPRSIQLSMPDRPVDKT